MIGRRAPIERMPERVKVLESSRHPFQIFTLWLCVAVGVPLLLGKVEANSINATMAPGARTIWASLLAGGAVIALLGMIWRNRATGLVIEQVGLVATGGATLVYAAAILASVGKGGAVATINLFSFGAAALWRWWQIQRQLIDARKLQERADA